MILRKIKLSENGNTLLTFVDSLYEEKVGIFGKPIIGQFDESSKIACMRVRGDITDQVEQGKEYPEIVASSTILRNKDGEQLTTGNGSPVYLAIDSTVQ